MISIHPTKQRVEHELYLMQLFKYNNQVLKNEGQIPSLLL